MVEPEHMTVVQILQARTENYVTNKVFSNSYVCITYLGSR